jgi:hypothetical protein
MEKNFKFKKLKKFSNFETILKKIYILIFNSIKFKKKKK